MLGNITPGIYWKNKSLRVCPTIRQLSPNRQVSHQFLHERHFGEPINTLNTTGLLTWFSERQFRILFLRRSHDIIPIIGWMTSCAPIKCNTVWDSFRDIWSGQVYYLQPVASHTCGWVTGVWAVIKDVMRSARAKSWVGILGWRLVKSGLSLKAHLSKSWASHVIAS